MITILSIELANGKIISAKNVALIVIFDFFSELPSINMDINLIIKQEVAKLPAKVRERPKFISDASHAISSIKYPKFQADPLIQIIKKYQFLDPNLSSLDNTFIPIISGIILVANKSKIKLILNI